MLFFHVFLVIRLESLLFLVATLIILVIVVLWSALGVVALIAIPWLIETVLSLVLHAVLLVVHHGIVVWLLEI